jgi:hypothetical protein
MARVGCVCPHQCSCGCWLYCPSSNVNKPISFDASIHQGRYAVLVSLGLSCKPALLHSGVVQQLAVKGCIVLAAPRACLLAAVTAKGRFYWLQRSSY